MDFVLADRAMIPDAVSGCLSSPRRVRLAAAIQGRPPPRFSRPPLARRGALGRVGLARDRRLRRRPDQRHELVHGHPRGCVPACGIAAPRSRGRRPGSSAPASRSNRAPGRLRQRRRTRDVEAQLDRRGDLVDVLPARPGRAYEAARLAPVQRELRAALGSTPGPCIPGPGLPLQLLDSDMSRRPNARMPCPDSLSPATRLLTAGAQRDVQRHLHP